MSRDYGKAGFIFLMGFVDPYYVWKFHGSPFSFRSLLPSVLAMLVMLTAGKYVQHRFNFINSSGRILVMSAFASSFMFALPNAGFFSLVLILLLAIFWANNRSWELISNSLCAVVVFFILTPYAFALGKSNPVLWLDGFNESRDSNTTVFLLFDELSAKAIEPLVTELTESEGRVWVKSLNPAGQNTINVIPSLFSQGRYAGDRVCGLSALCTADSSFDFSEVIVGRPDVDVIGFYMPYCAISNLRSCAFVPFVKNRDWLCAFSRGYKLFLERLGRSFSEVCASDLIAAQRTMLAATENALWAAPAWALGGVLYAHLPSPHPVGLMAASRSLSQDYESNLQDVKTIVKKALVLLRSADRPFRLIVFSDHPLRRRHCDDPIYAVSNCNKTKYFDDKVPLIVIGDRPSGFDAIKSNDEIFSLIN